MWDEAIARWNWSKNPQILVDNSGRKTERLINIKPSNFIKKRGGKAKDEIQLPSLGKYAEKEL